MEEKNKKATQEGADKAAEAYADNREISVQDGAGYPSIDDEIQQHRDILSVLGTVRGGYGNITVVQAIDNIQARLTELEARKRIEDEAAFEKIKDTEAYKHFRKMMEDEA